jgi:hypothetical protein
MMKRFVAASCLCASGVFAQTPDPTVQVLNAIAEGLERGQGITRRRDKKVLVQKDSEHHLVGTSSLDETVVGSCFDADFRPIPERLAVAVADIKGKDVDETAVAAYAIVTDEDVKLKASLLHLFNVGVEERKTHSYLVVSHGVTTKKWSVPRVSLSAVPEKAAYCAVEATEGRVVDVL